MRNGRFGTRGIGNEVGIMVLGLNGSGSGGLSAVVETSFSSLFGSFLTVKSSPVSCESSDSSLTGLLLSTKELVGVILVKEVSGVEWGGDTGGLTGACSLGFGGAGPLWTSVILVRLDKMLLFSDLIKG